MAASHVPLNSRTPAEFGEERAKVGAQLLLDESGCGLARFHVERANARTREYVPDRAGVGRFAKGFLSDLIQCPMMQLKWRRRFERLPQRAVSRPSRSVTPFSRERKGGARDSNLDERGRVAQPAGSGE
jgi:hypothetical protein